MKFSYTTIALFILSLSASHAVIIMDYDDGTTVSGPHSTSIQNGDITLQDWTGGHQYQTNNNSGIGSNQNLIVGSNRISAHTTGYSASVGDTFDASYMWRAAANWDTEDRMIFSLFYTDDNTISGARTSLFDAESAAHTATYSVETVPSHTVTDAGAAGKTIFVQFSDNASANGGEFTRLDNVFIEVTPVPEPSSVALLGLGGIALLLRRRK